MACMTQTKPGAPTCAELRAAVTAVAGEAVNIAPFRRLCTGTLPASKDTVGWCRGRAAVATSLPRHTNDRHASERQVNDKHTCFLVRTTLAMNQLSENAHRFCFHLRVLYVLCLELQIRAASGGSQKTLLCGVRVLRPWTRTTMAFCSQARSGHT